MITLGPFERATAIRFANDQTWLMFLIQRIRIHQRPQEGGAYFLTTTERDYHFKIGYRIGEYIEGQYVMVDHEVRPPVSGVYEQRTLTLPNKTYNNYPIIHSNSDPSIYCDLEIRNGDVNAGTYTSTTTPVLNPYYPTPGEAPYEFEFHHGSGVSQVRTLGPGQDHGYTQFSVSPVGSRYEGPFPVLTLEPPWVYTDHNKRWQADYPYADHHIYAPTADDVWDLFTRVDKWSLVNNSVEYLP